MQEDSDLGRVLWQCRRGALELDLILRPYIFNHYLTMSPERREELKLLLQEDDPSLLNWLVYLKPAPPQYQELIKDILQK